MPDGELLVQLRAVIKDYHALRPLRVQQLELRAAQSLALLGFDLAMSEVFVNLVTGAQLPDSGEVCVFGRPTTAIADAAEWVTILDQFGLVSERAVLLDQFTVAQNLAMPLSLEINDLSSALRSHARTLAEEVSLPADVLDQPTGVLSAAARLRLRLGRALAVGPRVLLAEHPNAAIPPDEVSSFAADLARVVGARRLSCIVLTADRTFASAVADEVLTLEPASGGLKSARGWRRWFT
jgi:ABC-type transporter Mla maintaining outer membrane lipid asymmetry ATPase subunit MlaF